MRLSTAPANNHSPRSDASSACGVHPNTRECIPGAHHRRRRRVLQLDPVRTPPGAINPVPVFGDDAFQTHPAGLFEHVRADLASPSRYPFNLWCRGASPIASPGPGAQRFGPDVLAANLQQVEGDEFHLGIMFARVKLVEVRPTVVVEPDRLVIDDEGCCPHPARRVDDKGIAAGQSKPPRVNNRTRSPSRWTKGRQPSCLISRSQCVGDAGRTGRDARLIAG